MIMDPVTLFEYERYPYEKANRDAFIGKKLYLSEATIAFIEELNSSKPFLETGLKTIRPLNYVGVIRTGDLTIQIFPKLFSDENISDHKGIIAGNILKMLSCTDNLPIKELDIASLNMEKFDLFEVFIRLFAEKLYQTIRYLQKHEYVNKTEELRVIKGKIIFKKYNNPAHLHIIPCKYYDFSLDNLLNRTLKYSCYLMSRSVTDFSTIRMLRGVVDILDNVSLTPLSVAEIERISFTRLNMMFEPFIRMCKIFLSHSTLTLQASDTESFSLLIPMERLFEEFISGMLKDEPEFYFGRKLYVGSQDRIGSLARDKIGKLLFRMKPDIILGESPKEAIIDTKYKKLDEDDRKCGVSQADLYQMYAYVVKTSVKKCMLLYPNILGIQKAEFVLPVPLLNGNSYNVDLFIRSISLSRDLNNPEEWGKFKNELKIIVNTLVPQQNFVME
jgi:5-methylcytosine-specific restriction enzyme subunit McrC